MRCGRIRPLRHRAEAERVEEIVVKTFEWACVAAVWATVLLQVAPVAARNRMPRWWGDRISAPRLWAAGLVVLAVGATLAIAVSGRRGSSLATGLGLLAVVGGLGMTGWAHRANRG
ncbi:hypothetical protein GCM10025734_78840 [Kitasatospora paranensis]